MIEVGACPRELKAFGRDLLVWLRAEFPEYAGWISGKCDLVALALQRWIGSEAEIWVHSHKRVPAGEWDHVLVKVGNCFLDDEGAWTEEEVHSFWPTYSEPVLRPAQAADDVTQRCPAWKIQEIVEGLEATFGPGKRVLEWAHIK